MHGEGHRRKCPECGQNVEHLRHVLSHLELVGPRGITSANVDRIFDNGGARFLIIEEKHANEPGMKKGQRILLGNLSRLPSVDVWVAKGTPESLTLYRVDGEVSAPILRGDFDAYQQAITSWFADSAERPTAVVSQWADAVVALAGLPYEAPSWCPPELWHQFELSLTRVREFWDRAVAS